jgi:hypothetical protein
LLSDGYYLLALDGVEYFSSSQIHCSQCLEKHHANGEVTYHHQLLGAALVCPGHKEVIPLMPEPILKQDGETKNDCERNSLKRFLLKFRQDHPHQDRHGRLIRQCSRDPRLVGGLDPVDHSRQAEGNKFCSSRFNSPSKA